MPDKPAASPREFVVPVVVEIPNRAAVSPRAGENPTGSPANPLEAP